MSPGIADGEVPAVRHSRVQRRLRQVILHQIVERLRLISAGEGDGGLGAAVPHLTDRIPVIHKY
jgi:hypothetical protein